MLRLLAAGCLLLTLGSPLQAHVAQDLAGRGVAQVPAESIENGLKLQWTLQRLVSAPGEEERYEAVKDAASLKLAIESTTHRLNGDSVEIRLKLTSQSKDRLFLRGEAKLTVPLAAGYQWWNGYDNQVRGEFDPHDGLLAKWFPVNTALDRQRGRGVGLGVNPRDVYSRIDVNRLEKADGGRDALTLALPCVLDEGQSFELAYVVTAFSAKFGFRDAIQNYYDLFPQAYQPAPGIDERMISTEVSYLAWSPANFGLNELTSPDMIRRFTGGYGGWEWCYAPMVRGGDWATTYEKTEGWDNPHKRGSRRGPWTRQRIDRFRENSRQRLENVAAINVAPMYYLNLMYIETTLADQFYAGAVFDRVVRDSVQGQEMITSIYPGWNAYYRDFRKAIEIVPRDFTASMGIGYDSAFGHRLLTAEVDGVEATPHRSFDKGNVVAIEGAAHASLFDLSRSLQSQGKPMGNAVNLKLTSPYFMGARTDAALYEGSPMERPERLDRVEFMRARLGSRKGMAWHKHLTPRHIRWIEWDRLEPAEMKQALRQVHDDNLLLSYYWGALAAPMMPAVGVERTFRATPELIELVRLGWQPSAKASVDQGLVVRYGQGLGANLVLLNAEYQPRTLTLTLDSADWNGWLPLLAYHDQDGQTLKSVMVVREKDGQVRAKVEVAPRSALRLVVAGQVKPVAGVNAPVTAEITRKADDHGRQSATYYVYGEVDVPAWEVQLLGDEQAGATQVTHAGKKDSPAPAPVIGQTWNTRRWEIDYQSSNENVRWARVYVDQYPSVRHRVSVAALQELKLPESLGADGQGVAVEAADEALAQKLSDWLASYATYTQGQAVRPVVTQDKAQASRIIRLKVDVNHAIAHHGQAEIRMDGQALEVIARSDEALARAVDALLVKLDQAYPYYGVLPASGDPYLEAMGLAGKTWFADDKPASHVAGPKLEERLKRAKLID